MISFCKIFYVSFIELLIPVYFLYRYFMGSDLNVARKYAAALKMVFPTVTANVSFLNLTVISAGIPQGTAILAATISTCL